MNWWGSICLILIFLAPSGMLEQRLQQFPQWLAKPEVEVATGELSYPQWMEGTWEVTSTLIDQVAPLAPDLVTPGFEANRVYLQKPVQFKVRFSPSYLVVGDKSVPRLIQGPLPITPDRAYNGSEIAQAYLGKDAVVRVTADPDDPNQQQTVLKGERLLTSIVTGRKTETVKGDRFIATEITQQVFRTPSQIYLNEVEATTAYDLISPNQIKGDQISAIYLSPQDPDYFKAGGRPIALYRYQLDLVRLETSGD